MAFKDQWTEEQDDFLRRCAEQGRSSREAAVLLGDLFGLQRSKMAVIGRANRKGIAFKGQIEAARRQAAAAEQRREARPKPAPRPKAEAATIVAKLMRKRAQLRAEQSRNQPAEAADELREIEAAGAAAQEGNPGILFLERSGLQCAWPMPGWDDLPVREKRVCGRPVTMRPGPYGAEATSWCRACQQLAYPTLRRKPLDAKHLARLDRSVRAA